MFTKKHPVVLSRDTLYDRPSSKKCLQLASSLFDGRQGRRKRVAEHRNFLRLNISNINLLLETRRSGVEFQLFRIIADYAYFSIVKTTFCIGFDFER